MASIKQALLLFTSIAILATSCSENVPGTSGEKRLPEFTGIPGHNNIVLTEKELADFDKEYSAFSTKALTVSYLKRKLEKWLGTDEVKLLKEIEYCRHKGQTDLPLKALFASVPTAELYDRVLNTNSIIQAISFNVPLAYFLNVTVNPNPGTPTGLSVDNISSAGFTAHWQPVGEATGYEISVDGGAPVDAELNTSYTANISGSNHTFKVRAIKTIFTGKYSDEYTVGAAPAIPTGLFADNITSEGFTTHWDSVSGATAYEIVIDGGSPVDVGMNTSYTANISGTNHTFKVRTLSGSDTGDYSDVFNVSFVPGAPDGLSADSITSSGFTAHWNSISGATSYDIAIDGGAPVNVGTNTFYAASIAGTNHTFKVRVIESSATGDYSGVFNVPDIPAAPASLSVDNISSAGFTAHWDSVSDATSYDIVIDGSAPVNIGTNTFYAASITGTNHTFKVRSIKGNATGDYSSVVNVPVIPGVPNIQVTDNITTSSFTAHWDIVSGATSYEISVDNNAAVSTGTNTFYNATALTGVNHNFKVRAIKDDATGDYSGQANVVLQPVPVTAGLRLSLDANNPSSYPGTGNTWFDLSGNSFNGTLVNGASYNSANGGSIAFDGSNDYVDLPYQLLSNDNTDFTVEVWFKFPAANTSGTLFANYPAGNFQVYSTNLSTFNLWLNNSSAISSVTTTANIGCIVAQRVSNNNLKLYLNNSLISTGNSTASIGPASFRLGINTINTEVFGGRIYNVKVYNRALTTQELTQNFDALRIRYGL
jgi:hypothetical protein